MAKGSSSSSSSNTVNSVDLSKFTVEELQALAQNI